MEREQTTFMQRFSHWLVWLRLPIVAVTLALTIVFALSALRMKLAPNLTKMLPQGHPYVKTHNAIRDVFGGVNSFALEVSVKDGTIFTRDTLQKIKDISDAFLVTRGIDKYKVFSIASRKAKYMSAGAWGMETRPLIVGEVPKDGSPEMEELKRNIYTNDQYYGSLVSLDGRSAVILGEYYEHYTDYVAVYEDLERIRNQYEDGKTSIHVGAIHISGWPHLLGSIIKTLPEMFAIFGVTLLIVMGLFYYWFGSLRGMLAPILASLTSIVWTVGFAGMIGIDLDPMTIVVPFLILAIGASHCAQKTRRFFEEYAVRGDPLVSAEETIAWLILPALAAILTDIAAFASLMLIPIRMIQEMAVVCTFGVASVIFTDIALVPLLFAVLPPKRQKLKEEGAEGFLGRVMTSFGHLALRPVPRYAVLAVTLGLLVGSTFLSRQIQIGDIKPGTPIYWPWQRINLDAAHIAERFLGADYLYVVMEGSEKNSTMDPEVLKAMDRYQRFIATDPNVGAAVSLVDIMKRINVKLHEDDPKWGFIPDTVQETMGLMYMWWSGADPGDLDRYLTYDNRLANITVLCKNRLGDTLRDVLGKSKAYIAENPVKAAQFRLAGGVVGTQAAVNEVLSEVQSNNVFEMLVIVFFFTAATFRSVSVGLLTMLPLAVGTFLMFAFMYLAEIDLNINTLPVAALGIGIGVDYAIYMVARILDEYRRVGTLDEAFALSLPTTGKTVFLTAVTFAAGVITWTLSSMRFQALMGLLLGFLFMACMLATLILVPSLVAVVIPRNAEPVRGVEPQSVRLAAAGLSAAKREAK